MSTAAKAAGSARRWVALRVFALALAGVAALSATTFLFALVARALGFVD